MEVTGFGGIYDSLNPNNRSLGPRIERGYVRN